MPEFIELKMSTLKFILEKLLELPEFQETGSPNSWMSSLGSSQYKRDRLK